METNLYKKTVNENLRRIRETQGLSTTQLAKILGVSQAKVSYIENGKGILSAADVAILSRRLSVPVTEFFKGLEDSDETGTKELIHHFVRFGAILLAKPKGISMKAVPFEDVFVRGLSFLDDPRLHQAFHAALITQASTQEIHLDRILAQVGGSPFLIGKTLKEVRVALQIIKAYTKTLKTALPPRAKTQLLALEEKALEVLKSARWTDEPHHSEDAELPEITKFVVECFHAKK